jgi:hypothetical protein
VVVGIFLAAVFFVILALVLAFVFVAVGFAAVAFLSSLDFLDALGFVAFLGALGLGFEALAGAGAGVGGLSSTFLVLAARAGCLRLGCKTYEAIVRRKSWLGSSVPRIVSGIVSLGCPDRISRFWEIAGYPRIVSRDITVLGKIKLFKTTNNQIAVISPITYLY